MLKRLAWNLAREGAVVLWLKPWSSQEGSRFLADLFMEVGTLEIDQKRIIIVMDDPIANCAA
jgi:hypothetical protein